jgi:CDK-activating kinase assembly factor MAT1
MCLPCRCDACVDRAFVAGIAKIPCVKAPICTFILRKEDFEKKKFANSMVHKEMRIRETELKEFVFSECDFDNLDEYNKYLEMVEDFAYNLVNEIDVDATRKSIQSFLEANRTRLRAAARRRAHEALEAKHEVDFEEKELKRKQLLAKLEREKQSEEVKQHKKAELEHVAKAGTFLEAVTKEPAGPAPIKTVCLYFFTYRHAHPPSPVLVLSVCWICAP